MRHMITQEDGMGCGAVCVAFSTNKTYQQAVKILGQQKARSVGFRPKELVDALSHGGLARETVSRELHKSMAEDVISITKQGILVDTEKLEEKLDFSL